jgi:multicomponent Na+:H+ antiporter subunit G
MSAQTLLALAADALVALALVVMTVGVLGLYRMRDVYLQLHAASKAVVLGVVALALASIATRDGAIIARAALLSGFLLLTTPVAAHAIARAAYLEQRSDVADESPIG